MSAFTYVWYVYDSYENKFKRPTWLNITVVAMAIIGVPYYLYASRPPEARTQALSGLLKFFVLMLITALTGQVIYSILFL